MLYICHRVPEVLKEMISILKFTNGHNAIEKSRLSNDFYSVYRLIMLHFISNFAKIS